MLKTAAAALYQPPHFVDADRLSRIQAQWPVIDNLIQAHAEKHHYTGYAFGIMVDGQLVHTGSGGYANLRQQIAATPQTCFRIASMTKSFTAMAILQLRDAGLLQLDEPVVRYIPALNNQCLTQDAPAITIRDLLTHSSGLPQDDPWGDRHLDLPDAGLIALCEQGVSFSTSAGTAYEYCNLTYALLGLIIRQVSGKSYQEFIAEKIWEPLGMTAVWDFSHVPAGQLAKAYRCHGSVHQEEKMLHDGSLGAMGGMICSVEAFSRYMALHMAAWPARNEPDNGPLSRSSIREMHRAWRFIDTAYKSIDGHPGAISNAYGYGLKCTQDSKGHWSVGHSGGLPGFGSNWMIMPDHGIGIVLLANVTYANAWDINPLVLEHLVNSAALLPRVLPVSAVLQEHYEAFKELLPGWKNADVSGLFADNFFDDFPLNRLVVETEEMFSRIGKVMRIGEMVAANQLRGYFMVEGEKGKLKVSFTLSPEKDPRIQFYAIEKRPGPNGTSLRNSVLLDK